MGLDDFLERGAEALEVSAADLKGRKRRASIVRGREILSWLGVELYGFSVKEISEALEKHFESVSRIVSRAASRRVEDRGFRTEMRRVDSVIFGSKEDGG
jgi:chromosomal replication initiation ATPase DnaA